MKRYRIAFISEHASPLAMPGSIDAGGQNVYVRELAMELSKLGFDIDVFTRRDDESLPEIIEMSPHIRVIHAEAGPACYIPKEGLMDYMDLFSDFMIKFIRKNALEYKLVHANFFMSGMVALRLKQILKIPFIITFHALGIVRWIHQKEADKFPRRRIFYEKRIVNQADMIIAECPQDASDLVNHYMADPRKMEIVPCGFNPEEFNPVGKRRARKLLEIDQNFPMILSVGRIVPRKGVDTIIQSMKYLKKRFSNIHLFIVGGDTDAEKGPSAAEILRLKKVAEDNKVINNVRFIGPKNPLELKYYYSAADVFISTPWYEPFGITPLESMACGTPVIGSDVGGIKYTVKEGVTGFLVPAKNPLKLSNRITRLLNDSELLRTMQKESIRRVNSFFTWQNVALEMKTAYLDIMSIPVVNSLIPVSQVTKGVESSALKELVLVKAKNSQARNYKIATNNRP